MPSKYPLSDEATSTVDEALIGTWIDTKDKEKRPLELRRKDGTSVMEDSDGESLYATTIGNDRYVSVPDPDEATGENLWNIYAYEILQNGDLKVYGLDPDAVADAIAKGDLAGTVKSRRVAGWWSRTFIERDIEISDTPEHIRGFLMKRGRKCWLLDKDAVTTFVRR